MRATFHLLVVVALALGSATSALAMPREKKKSTPRENSHKDSVSVPDKLSVLSPEVIKSLNELLTDKKVVLYGHTGTGKTGAFGQRVFGEPDMLSMSGDESPLRSETIQQLLNALTETHLKGTTFLLSGNPGAEMKGTGSTKIFQNFERVGVFDLGKLHEELAPHGTLHIEIHDGESSAGKFPETAVVHVPPSELGEAIRRRLGRIPRPQQGHPAEDRAQVEPVARFPKAG